MSLPSTADGGFTEKYKKIEAAALRFIPPLSLESYAFKGSPPRGGRDKH
jgi:hypothetical protein